MAVRPPEKIKLTASPKMQAGLKALGLRILKFILVKK